MKPYQQKLNDIANTIIHRLESLPVVEKLVFRYENLDQQRQRWYKTLAILTGLSLGLWIFGGGLWNVWSIRRDMSKYENLIEEARAIYQKPEIEYRPAPPPQGTLPLNATNLDQLENVLFDFLAAQVGLPQTIVTITRSGQNDMNIELTDLTIRQATKLIHQVDAWFPQLKNLETKVAIHDSIPELLKLSMKVSLNASAQAASGTRTRDNKRPNAGGSGSGSPGANNPGNPDSNIDPFGADYGPPPGQDDTSFPEPDFEDE